MQSKSVSEDSPHQLRCLFSAQVEATDDGYVIEMPRADVTAGTLEPDGKYQVALLEHTNQTPPTPQPPVEPGETRYVDIDDTGKQGDGIARVERGYVLIVPETTVGDRVKVEVTAVNETFAVAEVCDL